MKRVSRRKLSLYVVVAFLSVSVHAQNKFDDPKKTLKKHFWGDLYKGGGETFYCKKSFKKKSVLVTESYIYSTSTIRDHLLCGTPRQCRADDEQYRFITSDLHNIYPADARFELKRRNAKFEDLGDDVEAGDCGEKRSFVILEPPKAIKGDIARALFYMHETYGLPIQGDLTQLKRWNLEDPPSDAELERNARIKTIQGNDNPYILNPALANQLTLEN